VSDRCSACELIPLLVVCFCRGMYTCSLRFNIVNYFHRHVSFKSLFVRCIMVAH